MLILSSCSSAYRTAQTPDDVYYSPATPRVYANNSNDDRNEEYTEEETYDENGEGNYVTYEDEDGESYDYARRIERFNYPYSGSYWDGYYDALYNRPFGGFGWNTWGPSIGIGLGWGYSPWRMNSWYGGGWGGWYDPWYTSSWGYGGWGHPYYPYYGGGWYGGGYIKSNPRPANSWGPRGAAASRVFSPSTRPNTTGNAPTRVYNGRSSSGTAPANAPRRTFRPSPSERPVTQPSRSNNQPSRQAERRSNAPARQQRTYEAPRRESAPTRTYPSNNNNNNSNSPSRSAPSRSFPRGGR